MSTPALPRPLDCDCFAVRSAARHVTQLYDRFLAPVGFRITQLSILAKLSRSAPLTINALADDMVMDRTTLGPAIGPLKRDGLIRIERAPSDGRAKQIYLTKAGEKSLQAGLHAWTKAQAHFEASYGIERAGELRTLLRAVVAC
jgi:DNA-binding MarR family transcriptional regulator